MFGITRKGNVLYATVFVPDSQCVSVKLFGKNGESEKIAMQPDREFTGVFSCSIPLKYKGWSYCYETEHGELADRYAYHITSRDEFSLQTDLTDSTLNTVQEIMQRFGKQDEGQPAAKALLTEAPSFVTTERIIRNNAELIIYKLHVRGFTKHGSSRIHNPGTFKGVTQKLPHIKKLGVNCILLMPCYDFDEAAKKGTRLNFWGYGAEAAYFAPKASFAAVPENVCREFAGMIDSFHKAGISVMMEMSFDKGVSASFAVEVLSFWAHTYHVDGFRILGGNSLVEEAAKAPLLKGITIICDNWEGIQGSDRASCISYNQSYLWNLRKLLKGDEGQVKEFSHNFRDVGTTALKINYVADNNGFTLADIFAYDQHHNEANGENNNDGLLVNHSWNCGTEGVTGKKSVLLLRQKMVKNAIALLMMSRGIPLIMAGDEFLCSHEGNNNPYCCDNEQGWVIWERNSRAREVMNFTSEIIALRKNHPVIGNGSELQGIDYLGIGSPDISYHGLKAWYPDYGYFSRTLGILLEGKYAVVERNQKDVGFFITINMHWEEHEFDIPGNEEYQVVFSTDKEFTLSDGRSCIVAPRSIAVLKLMPVETAGRNKKSRRSK